MRVASSGAHDFVAVGGASVFGSIASFGWIGPQAANRQAQPADKRFGDPLRDSLGGRRAIRQFADLVAG
jgi:hypothetical protein